MTTPPTTPPLRSAFYSDDFTGATDLLGLHADHGVDAAVFLAPPHRDELADHPAVEVIGVAGTSRTADPTGVRDQVGRGVAALVDLGAPLVQYKVCSTFDSSPEVGSIGAAIDAGASVVGRRAVPVVGATPHLGRHVVFGTMFATVGSGVRPVRLDRHPVMATHPTTPMHEADLGALLVAQADLRVGAVDVLGLAGTGSLDTALDAPDLDAVVIDGLTDDHLRQTGEVLHRRAGADRPAFAVGAAGLARALLATGPAPAAASGALPPAAPASPVLVISGSASVVTARQLDRAVASGYRCHVVAVSDAHAAEGSVDLATAVDRATRDLASGHSVVVRPTAARGDDVRVRDAIEQLARELVDDPDVRVVVCGGDTSGLVARTVGARSLTAIADLAPAVPLCRVRRREGPDLEIAFKGGQVGGDDLLERARKGAGP